MADPANAHDISLEGLDKVQAAVKAVQDRFKNCQAATEALTVKLIQQTAAASGLSEKWITQALKVELNRQKLKDLTEQTVKFGLATVDSVQRKAVTAWSLLTVGATGFALSGLRASGIGEVFSFKMERLGRVVAGLVAPEFEKLIGLVDRFTSWIVALDPAQKELIAHWLEMSAVGLTLSKLFGGWIGLLGGVTVGFGQSSEVGGRFAEIGQKIMVIIDKLTPALETLADIVASTLGVALDVLNSILENSNIKWIAAAAGALLFAGIAVRLIGAITAIVGALKILTAAKITALAFSGPAGWAALAAGAAIAGATIYGAVTAFNAFDSATGKARKGHEHLRNEVAKGVGGPFADVMGIYNMIAAASVKVGQVSQKQGVSTNNPLINPDFGDIKGALEKIERNTHGTKESVDRIKPPFAK